MLDSSNNQEAQNPIEDAKSAVQTTAKTAKTAVKAGKTAIEVGKIAGATVATGGIGGLVMGAKMLAAKFANKIPLVGPLIRKLNDLAKKIIAGAGILTAYLLALLVAKLTAAIAGLAVGAAIGFVVGGPVGAVVGAAVGAAFGPQIASAIGNSAGLAKSATSAVGHGATSIVSGIGNAISGAISSAGSAIGSAISGTFGALGGAANFLTSLGGISLPASIVTVPLAVGVGSVGIGSIFIAAFITPAAFFSVTGDQQEGPPPTPGQNKFFTLTKTANPSIIPNQPIGQIQQIDFTITLTTKDTKLINIQVTDGLRVQSATNPPPITQDINGNTFASLNCPPVLDPGANCTITFRIRVDSAYNNSILSNTVRVTAQPDVPGQPPVTDSSSATVVIGTPPIPNCGAGSSFASLLPNPIPSSAGAVSPGSFGTLDSGGVVAAAKNAAATTGIPCEMLVGVHYIEGSWADNRSFISGRLIGDIETDVRDAALCTSHGGNFVGNGCIFSNLQDTANYAGDLIKDKIAALTGQRRAPSNFAEMIGAMSYYNGGGNANCGKSVSYTSPCPPPIGIDDPYAMSHFDSEHASMYLIYCADFTLCNPPQLFSRDGAATAAKEFYKRTNP